LCLGVLARGSVDRGPGDLEAGDEHLFETRTFGSRVIYERYGRAREESD